MLRQLLHGGRLNVHAGAGRYVVQDGRQPDLIHHIQEVGNQAGLRGLVVIGGHQQQRIRAQVTGGGGQPERMGGVVGTGAGNHRHTARSGLYGGADGGNMLLVGEGGGFARGAADDNGVGAALNLLIHQTGEQGVIHRAVGLHRGDDGHTGTGENSLFLHKMSASVLR